VICPGDFAWLHGEPVTVFAVQSNHLYIIPGHHSWTTCRLEDVTTEVQTGAAR
jgi:hypothetical protein